MPNPQVAPSFQSSPSSAVINIAQVVKQFKDKIGSQLELTEAQKTRLKKRLKKEIAEWKSDSSELHAKLELWNDLMENMVDDGNLPFDGASNVHIPIVAIFCKVYHSVERRSILGSDSIWYLNTRNQDLKPHISDIDEAVNYKARTEWNTKEALSDVMWATNRDGLDFLEIDYVIETEKVQDMLFIANDEQFMDELPNPKEAGLTLREWTELRMEVALEGSEETPIEIPVEEEVITYRGPKAEVVELADFVSFPAYARSLHRSHCRGFGKRFTLRSGEVRRKIEEDNWDEEECEKLLKRGSQGSQPNAWDRAKESAQGFSRTGKSDEHELYKLVYRFRLDRGEDEAKLIVIYSAEKDALPFCSLFYYRMDNYVPFRIEKKANQLLGNSVPGGLMDLNDEVDAHHNQRINSRKISEVPSFKGKKSGGPLGFDPEASENKWRPGVIFWMDDPALFEQFKVQPADFTTSIAEEKNTMLYCALWAGIDPFTSSGNTLAQNPNASQNKTEMLIAQSNMRMDDVLSTLRPSVEQVGKVCLSQEYQFGPALIQFEAKGPNGQSILKQLPKRFLRNGIDVDMHGTTVVMNPEAEFAREFNYYLAFQREPAIAKSSKRRVVQLRNAMQAGRVRDRDKIIPTDQELDQMDAQAAKMQLLTLQVQLEKARAGIAKDKMKVIKDKSSLSKDRMKNAKDKLGLVKTAQGIQRTGAEMAGVA